MPLFLDTRGKTYAAVAICDRCRVKYPLGDLGPDPNAPGLRVCKECTDELDPYRLPARQTERITLPFVRPDAPLSGMDTGYILLEFGPNSFLLQENEFPSFKFELE